ncbi:hypothetical protein CCACVL1_25071 [Corchorus capsularis]|uniref:Uncharacterized protein n=1 Tax=Corchorus capsularis TaxID=210143 RepID=A0A1R3GM46_COCAP|nr:hypothetical protein CCACVL1_25071 [Corchorus capsularis]
MAFASILRKSANSLAPLAIRPLPIRLTGVQRNYNYGAAAAAYYYLQSQKKSRLCSYTVRETVREGGCEHNLPDLDC